MTNENADTVRPEAFEIPFEAFRPSINPTWRAARAIPAPGDCLEELHAEWFHSGSPHKWEVYVLLATGFSMQAHDEIQVLKAGGSL